MSYRFSDHLKGHDAELPRTGHGRIPCPKCEEPIPSNSEECPFCGIHFSGGTAYDLSPDTLRRKRAKARRFQLAAWLLILAFLVPTLLVLIDFLRSR